MRAIKGHEIGQSLRRVVDVEKLLRHIVEGGFRPRANTTERAFPRLGHASDRLLDRWLHDVVFVARNFVRDNEQCFIDGFENEGQLGRGAGRRFDGEWVGAKLDCHLGDRLLRVLDLFFDRIDDRLDARFRVLDVLLQRLEAAFRVRCLRHRIVRQRGYKRAGVFEGITDEPSRAGMAKSERAFDKGGPNVRRHDKPSTLATGEKLSRLSRREDAFKRIIKIFPRLQLLREPLDVRFCDRLFCEELFPRTFDAL
ncbi:MAG TPA: hypothetical protein VNE84_02980 [Candidatus Limnocylindria bacterium]|nr:hypothetical protein [Candidatus Limnocylindria bacterium]